MEIVLASIAVCLFLIAYTGKKTEENKVLLEETESEAPLAEEITVEKARELVLKNEVFDRNRYYLKYKENIVLNNVEYFLFLAYNISTDTECLDIEAAYIVTKDTGEVAIFSSSKEKDKQEADVSVG